MSTFFEKSKIGNRKPFRVPDNYFEHFATNLDAVIAPSRVSPFVLIRPWLYMVALFVAVFFLVKVAYNLHSEKQIAQSNEYELYVLTQVNDMESVVYDLTHVN